jgi:hypothetical protein
MIVLGRKSLGPEGTERRNWRITFHRNELLPVERRRLNGFLDFVAGLVVSNRCSAPLVRSSNFFLPPVQLENPLSLLPKQQEAEQQTNGSHSVYVEEGGFCLK